MLKVVKTVLPRPHPHWVGDGFHVYPVFANKAFSEELSPFLMFDYAAPKKFSPTTKKLGVGTHPHRGFETISIAFQGEVEHGDNKGNKGVIGPGDVQWMKAARGIVHEEFHSRAMAASGGVFEFCQLWLNLPASEKMSEPAYQPILAGDIQESRLVAWDGRHEAKIDATEPVSESEALEKGDLVKVKGLGSRPELNGRLGRISSPTKAGERVEVFITGELLPKALRRYNLERVLADPDTQMGAQEDGNVRVIAGRYGEAIGPAKTVTQVDLWDVSIDNTEGTYQFDMMPGNNVIVFTRKGRVEVQGKPLGPQDVALMGTAGSRLLIKAIEPSKVLVLAGQPLNEPIASRGPFVMNTPEELRQAMHDFQMGRF